MKRRSSGSKTTGARGGRRDDARGGAGGRGGSAKPAQAPAKGAKAGGARKPAPWLPDAPATRGPTRSRPPEMPAPRELEERARPRREVARDAAPGPARGPREHGAPAARAGRDDPYAQREAQRYERPIPSREAIIAFLNEEQGLLTAERIADALGLRDVDALDALVKRLTAMVRDGQLLMNRRGGYGVAERLDLIAGGVIANAEGYGFLRPDDGGDDLYLSPAQMRVVLHGDRVLASVVGLDRRGRREGAIVEVLERRAPRLVGRYQEQDGFGLVVPDDRRIHQDLLIPQGRSERARSGQIVVAEIIEPPTRERPPTGRVVAVLGDRLTASLTVKMAIESRGLPHEWPTAVTREVEQISPEVSRADRAGRVDLREMPLVTIDGEDSRDFDDAVYAERRRGGFRLVVAIADVSHYVKPGTALDDEAYNRATSVYFPDFVVPMLPESLSNGICSLNPNVDRLCMVCDMEIGKDGEVERSEFYPAVMRSHARMTYTEVWKALGEGDTEVRARYERLMPHLEDLYALFKALKSQRVRRGAIDFESQEFKFKLAPSGEVLAMGAYERNDAHMLIEECMIAANVQAARFVEERQIPAPFRVHARPPEEKYDDLVEFLKEFGLRMPPWAQAKPGDFAKLLKQIKGRADEMLLQSVLLRSQSLAVYLAENGGHFGLALEAYSHFTSPIRRYPDLLLHRAIRHALKGGKKHEYQYGEADMAARCAHCSTNERRADEAERDVDERYKCAWMEKHIGTEFDGVVSGVTSFGLFVELVESRVSGLVHVTQLPNDYYHFDAKRHVITGERRGLRFRLGDKVRVLVLRASLEDRKIDFRLVEERGEKGEGEGALEFRTGKQGRAGARDDAPRSDRGTDRGAARGAGGNRGGADRGGGSGDRGRGRGGRGR